MIKVVEISKSFGKRLILHNISFELNAGEIVGLIGSNGAGKSTLLKIITGLILPDSGFIKYENINTTEIATIFEEHRFLNNFSGLKNIELFFESLPDQSPINIEKAFEEYGLYHFRNAKFKTYSSGMKRRLDLMSIFLLNKKVFFLDEPTNALDIDSISIFNQKILKLKEQGKTVIISSHHVSELEKICDKYFIINNTVVKEINKDEIDLIYGSLEETYFNLTTKVI